MFGNTGKSILCSLPNLTQFCGNAQQFSISTTAQKWNELNQIYRSHQYKLFFWHIARFYFILIIIYKDLIILGYGDLNGTDTVIRLETFFLDFIYVTYILWNIF